MKYFLQEARVNKSKSSAALEKEARRKEHARRVLQNQQQRDPAAHTAAGSSSSAGKQAGVSSTHAVAVVEEESKFQALFQKRTDGFVVDFMFRNAPPRPPVGPCFVGLGLDGELNDKWTKYKPHNAIEVNHVWKLHVEPDLGVPIASTAIQLNLYVNPTKRAITLGVGSNIDETMFIEEGNRNSTASTSSSTTMMMHPDDAALLNWKGSMGDTTGETLQLRRDYARAAARMQHRLPQGGGDKYSASLATSRNTMNNRFQIKKSQGTGAFTSRVLQERNPFFMRKTTYLSNDTSQSVHAFKSLTETRSHFMEETSKRYRQEQDTLPTQDFIEQTFDIAKSYTTTFYSSKNSSNLVKDDNEKGEEEDKQQHSPQKKIRIHPTKKHIVAVAEYPLFPNLKIWNKTCIHVAMDHLPKKVGTTIPPSYAQMQKALIMDVHAKENDLSTRMECNIVVPTSVSSLPIKDLTENKQHEFTAVHKYDLEVVHIKDDTQPLHNTFLFVVDKNMGMTTYHPISSRVNLSSGRPISIHERNRKNTVVEPDHHDELLDESPTDNKITTLTKHMSRNYMHDDED